MTPNPTDTRTVQLHLSATVVELLQQKANANSLSLEVYLEELAEQAVSANGHPDPLEEAVKRITSRTPEQIMADRERLLASSPPARPLPEGKTLFDVVEGTWPGDQTDEEIRIMLERLL